MTQTTLSSLGGPVLDPAASRFIKTTWMLNVRTAVRLDAVAASVRYMDANEANRLADLTGRKNIVHERGFYVKRARQLADRSIVEVIRSGPPSAISRDARVAAELIEAAAVTSAVLYTNRRAFQTALGVSGHRKDVLDFAVGPEFRRFSTSSRPEPQARGITVDHRFGERFKRLELERVVVSVLSVGSLHHRLRQALTWLLESRLEFSEAAAVVKLAIAFEGLLGENDTEPLRRTLSERAAFLLSAAPATRAEISKLVKGFYDIRSHVVHGSRRKSIRTVGRLLEAAERVCFLCLITVAVNDGLFKEPGAIAEWVERQRWGAKGNLWRPFRPGDLKRALVRGIGTQ